MRQACVRAVEIGLLAITFTDHADLTTLVVPMRPPSTSGRSAVR